MGCVLAKMDLGEVPAIISNVSLLHYIGGSNTRCSPQLLLHPTTFFAGYNCPSYGSCQDGRCVCPTGYDNGSMCDECECCIAALIDVQGIISARHTGVAGHELSVLHTYVDVTICHGGFPCYHNGQCGNSSCVCPPGYTGLYCEMKECKYVHVYVALLTV